MGRETPASPRNDRPLRNSGSNSRCAKGRACARPQTVLAEYSCRFWFERREACFAKPLPNRSDSHREPVDYSRLSPRRRPGSKLTLFYLGPSLRRATPALSTNQKRSQNSPPLKHRQRSTRRHKQTSNPPIRPSNVLWVFQHHQHLRCKRGVATHRDEINDV